MTPELELLEQLLDVDWPLARAVELLERSGRDGWRAVQMHWADGNVVLLAAADLEPLEDWRAREVFRVRAPGAVLVRCTARGARLVT